MLVILFCNLLYVYEYVYARSNLAVVVFFIVKSESKRSPGDKVCGGGHERKYSSDIRL